jgi:hypothetical protein
LKGQTPSFWKYFDRRSQNSTDLQGNWNESSRNDLVLVIHKIETQ